MAQKSHYLDEMPPDMLEDKLKQTRFEMLTPVYGVLAVIGCLLFFLLLIGGPRSLLQLGLRYAPYVFVILFIIVGLYRLHYQRFLDWERRFTAQYCVGTGYWLPSKVKLLPPRATSVVLILCVVGFLVSMLGSRPQQSADPMLDTVPYTWMEEGDIAYESAEYDKALEDYTRGLEAMRAAEDDWGEAVALMRLGGVYTALGAYPDALTYFEEALEIVRTAEESGMEVSILLNIGIVYYEQGRDKPAREYLTQALYAARGRGTETTTRALIYIYLGRMDLWEEAYNTAISRAVNARNLCQRIQNVECEIAAIVLLAQAYIGYENYEEASTYLTQALGLAQEMEAEELIQVIQELLEGIPNVEDEPSGVDRSL